MYVLCAMLIGLEVYTLCVIMISSQIWRFTSVHVVCDDDKFEGPEVWKFVYCA